MRGLVIWSQSNCRSTMALYRELIRLLKVPSIITLWHFSEKDGGPDLREKVGFCHSEFDDLKMMPVGEDYEKGLCVLDQHPDWHHLFCVYQPSPVYRKLIVEVKRRGGNVGVMCESPCNMESGWRKPLKAMYIRFFLPIILRKVVSAADFFVNYSGDETRTAEIIGWPKKKIIPFGYFSPPIKDSKCKKRHRELVEKPLFILTTGILSKYRGADVLVEALKILKERGVSYRAVITQKGELWECLKKKSKAWGLGVEFPGFVEMPSLIKMYEDCDVYVGTGRSEPWGMRLNDVLQCGAPLLVSRGMGGVQMVDRYECGASFASGDSNRLAELLEKMATDAVYYNKVAANALSAAEECNPKVKAKELLGLITTRRGEWLK